MRSTSDEDEEMFDEDVQEPDAHDEEQDIDVDDVKGDFEEGVSFLSCFAMCPSPKRIEVRTSADDDAERLWTERRRC